MCVICNRNYRKLHKSGKKINFSLLLVLLLRQMPPFPHLFFSGRFHYRPLWLDLKNLFNRCPVKSVPPPLDFLPILRVKWRVLRNFRIAYGWNGVDSIELRNMRYTVAYLASYPKLSSEWAIRLASYTGLLNVALYRSSACGYYSRSKL